MPPTLSITSVQSAPFCALGFDVGGTKIAAGLVSFPEGVVRARRLIPTRPERGGKAVFADVERLAHELAAEAHGQQSVVQAIGIGVCELVDFAGNIASASSFDWRGLPLRERLAPLAPVVVEADVRAAALGEALLASVRRHIWSEPRRDLPLLPAAIGPDAGIIGAATAAWLSVEAGVALAL